MVSAIRVADVNAGWIRMSGPVKSPEDRPRSPRRGPARVAQCPHERRSGARGRCLFAHRGKPGWYSGAVLKAPALVAGLDDFAVMGQAIEERGRHLGVGEYHRLPLFRIDW